MPQNNETVLEKAVADQWKVLPSGLTVLVRPMPGYSSTHVIFATRFGSIDRDFRLDGKEVHLPAGVAHFLEHKMFEDQDGDAFAKYAKTGANANAFTSFDRTCYLFTATQQLDESLDVLLGMVAHPYFTEQTIAKEQGIIGQEIKMYDDSPDWRLITGLFECLYAATPSAATSRARWRALPRSPRRCSTTAAGRSMPGQYGAGRRWQHHHGAGPGRLRAPRPDGAPQYRAGAAAVDAGAHDACHHRNDPENAGVQALLRPRFQGRAAAGGRPAHRGAV